MLIKYGKGTKKFRFPVDLHLKQAVGALTLHTGVGTIFLTVGIKNTRSNKWRAFVALSKCNALQIL